ncbi:uncharacterized protein [Blastocystis hominis]|uniref:EF-hand domain-containing protein n=1 Tax=Blastocystis hominis TaxID=12968 RepID=D8LX00_BLAHO|nr:uncharacterized protein [Blastocystis hominis]CBK20795.2 unnamed protein product [Blastocystis hominis]|eukprot:XP_012894843.1 uncharacterized protein [Blastocystis hominis]
MCYHHYIYLTTVAAAILFSLNGLTSTMVGKREFMHSGLFTILQLLDKKPITVILPFAPSYSQQIFTRFQSLCDTFDAEILNQSCSTCLHHSPNFDTQFVISASKLMDSMNPKLSRLCFNRAFSKIHALLNHPEGMQIHYEAYAMFNILYNDAMEGSSRRFWFEIMDGDGDGVLNKEDIQELVREWNTFITKMRYTIKMSVKRT